MLSNINTILYRGFNRMPRKKKIKEDPSSSSSSSSKTCKTKQNTTTEKTSKKGPIRHDTDKNILIEIYAKPGAKQNCVTDISDEGINIQINAPPVEGSANIELVKYVASLLGVKSSSISLERGHKSRNKVIKIISGNSDLSTIIEKFNAELPANKSKKIPEEV